MRTVHTLFGGPRAGNPSGMAVTVQPGIVVVYADVVWGWATVALHRFYRARERGAGFPVVDEDDPSAMKQLVQRAAGATGG